MQMALETVGEERPGGARVETHQTLAYLMIAGAVMLFTTFTASYLVRRESPDWGKVALPSLVWLNTAIVLASSVTMELARLGRGRSRFWVRATLALGLLFVAGQSVAWRQLAAQGVFMATSPHASFFYVLTAVHSVHLAAGIAVLLWALRRAGRAPLGLCAAWWHFVGAAWVWVALLLRFF